MNLSESVKLKFIFLFKNILSRQNIFISRGVAADSLERFFKQIKPIQTNYDLIRIGTDLDGGYLVPNDLLGVDACFSPGVSVTSDFELEMANRGIKCFMADYSVDGPALKHDLFYFEKKFIGSENNDMYMTLNNWVTTKTPSHRDMILQMDIEGSEYKVILDTAPKILRQFRIIIIEFHDLEQILSKLGFSFINQAFEKLLRDFEIVHIHPNNIMKAKRAIFKDYEIPPVLEMTFLRKDRIKNRKSSNQFPHQLDRPNSLEFEDYFLPRCWFNSQ